jgi:hypothetical protein
MLDEHAAATTAAPEVVALKPTTIPGWIPGATGR